VSIGCRVKLAGREAASGYQRIAQAGCAVTERPLLVSWSRAQKLFR
jgi:hypothetical protein